MRFTKLTREILKRLHNKCGYCGWDFDQKNLSIDHIVPRSRGGNDHPNNIMVCCIFCNSTKRDKTLSEFREFVSHWVNDYPYFTVEQIEFLKKNDIELPLLPEYIFHFERIRDGQN